MIKESNLNSGRALSLASEHDIYSKLMIALPMLVLPILVLCGAISGFLHSDGFRHGMVFYNSHSFIISQNVIYLFFGSLLILTTGFFRTIVLILITPGAGIRFQDRCIIFNNKDIIELSEILDAEFIDKKTLVGNMRFIKIVRKGGGYMEFPHIYKQHPEKIVNKIRYIILTDGELNL